MTKHPSVWAFGLGKASIGEAVRLNENLPHKPPLLIRAECAEKKKGRAKRPVWKSSFLPYGRSGSALLSTYRGRPTGFDPRT